MAINLDGIKKKMQEALDHSAPKIEQGLDKASGFAKSKFSQYGPKIDNVTTKAKDILHKGTGSEGKGKK
ncbi:Rv0909 family putative TA system antitoxin [Amycolatopsis taiwanensis]|uniref:Antitoxin n=1 Tax=Amycolatopsis taiwanensis TaxID=342230 RepID=A0A9W6QVT4_9PSEU|nr:Rv0909 family putative TA system antitoxin [Amycolatopsis taiwanensis]GLY63855.1 hypothetical protein Atai01_04740 [Amycolatopsis taiwanensis]